MTVLETVSSIIQLDILLFSVILGALFEVVFEFFNIIVLLNRAVSIKKSIFIVILDIVYFLTVTVVTHLFMIAVCDGKIRLYIILGEIIGFLLVYFSLGRIFRFLFDLLFKLLTFLFYKLLFNSFVFIFKAIFNFFRSICRKIKQNFKKPQKLVKKT